MKNIIFLDIDGVLNCQLFYESQQCKEAREGDIKNEKTYIESMICRERVKWLSDLCEETDTAIVISSSWRSNHTIPEFQQIFNELGGTFKIIGKTGYCNCRVRGVEIKEWLSENCERFFGVMSHDFYRYAIIDDDGDMLLWQQNHFFQTDDYSGLTPTTCYKIKRFFTHETF